MAETASDMLAALRNAFAGASGGRVKLDAAFWQAAGVPAPPGFDALLTSAFQASSLDVSFDPGTVGAIAADRFAIPSITFPFFKAQSGDLGASLFAFVAAGADTPTLCIQFSPATWRLTDQFPLLAGRLFDLVAIARPSYLFASQPATLTLDALGRSVSVEAGLTYCGMLALPLGALPIIGAINGLVAPVASLPAWGPLDFAGADDENALLPQMALSAPMPVSQALKLFFLEVDRPRLGFAITNATVDTTLLADDEDDEDDDEPAPPAQEIVQSEDLFVALDLTICNAGAAIGVVVEASVRAPVKRGATALRFRVVPRDDMGPLTPQAAIALVNGNSYFDKVPASLRTALSSVGLEGVTLYGLSGTPPRLTQIGIRLGSTGKPIALFADPTSGAPFTIECFALTFLVADPFDSAARQTSATFDAGFTLLPDVFRKKTGEPGGLFEIEIDSDLNFEGGFTGQASLDDILRKVTGGAIGLPDGVSVAFSDIYLSVQSSARAYTLEFAVDAALSVPFLSDGSRPLIQILGLRFTLGASTPKAEAGAAARTVYTGAMAGQMLIGDLAANVAVAYDGAAPTPTWRLAAALAEPLSLSALIGNFFRKYDLPDILPGDLVIAAFAMKATIPGASSASQAERRHSTRPHGRVLEIGTVAAPAAKAYEIAATLTWRFSLGPLNVDTRADIGLAYDAAQPDGRRYSGSVIATIRLDLIGEVEIGYRFGPASADAAEGAPPAAHAFMAADGDSTVLWLRWKGFRAAYDRSAETVTFSLTGYSLGALLTDLVAMIGGNPYFSLPAPWSVLDFISLDGISLVFHLKREAGKPRVSATYSLPSAIDLGIIRIEGLSLSQVDGKVRLGLVGSSPVPSINDSSLLKPEGQDVTQMPKVPGRGNAFFDLRLLALGQRVAIDQPGAFNSTKDVVAALRAVPPSDGDALPFDPSKRTPGQPVYAPGSNWLAAMSFGLLRIGDGPTYAIDLMIVFNDPDLYGLRLALSGEKVKVLDGLAIDILYKKVSDDVGCYQIEFTLPSVLRNLDFGAFAVTLPVIGLQVYTNGDFLVDFGFPYALDFSRSFTAQAIIMGVPVIGSAGFYFGKLSSATATGLPATTKGSFHPVIVFGFGAQLGVGKTIDKGILKAGILVTVFGIIEGTIAAWHAYAANDQGGGNAVQGDYYFKLAGSFGLIGKLYGTVDFAVVKADVSLTVQLVAAIAYESFRAIPLSLSASVSVHVSISIDCGFFSISIGFSFATTLRVELTIGHDEHAPWDPDGTRLLHRHLHALALSGPVVRFQPGQARARLPRLAGASRETLHLLAVPQFTVLGPEDGGALEGAFVLVFAMDAPKAGDASDGAQTSFGKLCAALLPWILAGTTTHEATTQGLPTGVVSRVQLEAVLAALSDVEHPPFGDADIEGFLADHFTIEVAAAEKGLAQDRRIALDAGATIFPAIPALSLTIPDPSAATGTLTIDLARYCTATPDYEAAIRAYFKQVAAAVEREQGAPTPLRAEGAAAPRPLAGCVLVDYALLLARQLVQGAIDAFDDFAYPLEATTSLADVVAFADAAAPGQVDAAAIAQANLLYPLQAGKSLAIGTAASPLRYTVQAGDTLAAIAARYTGVGAPDLVLANAAQNNLIVPGVTVTIGSATLVTRAGDSFAAIAAALGVDVATLAQNAALPTLPGLLAPSVALTVTGAAATTTAGQTLEDIAALYDVPVAALLGPANLAVPGLFVVDAAHRFAVPALAALPQASLWPALLRTGTLGHLAGMAARTMMHGMRLPTLDGLGLPANFLYGAPRWPAQRGYGLYQLTGQQVPLAASNPDATITLSRPASGYDWLVLGAGSSLAVPLASQDPAVLGPKALLLAALETVRAKGYAPSVTALGVEPAATLVPKRWALGTFARWTSSDVAGLAAVAAPPGQPARATAASQPQPILWALSSALMRAAETRQAALAQSLPDTRDQSRYMPVLAPELGRRDPATGRTSREPIADYALATRIDFKVKHLAQDVDLAPQAALANAIVPPGDGNAGSPARALAPFAYEVVGPSAAQAILLQRLLSAMADQGDAIVSGLFLAYADANTGNSGLVGRAPEEFLAFLVQSNLSTETNPGGALTRLAAANPSAPRGIANSKAEFVKLLWELSTVSSGGTYLFFQLVAEGGGLPPALFDASGQATLTLVVTYAREAGLAGGACLSHAMNALVTTAPIDPTHAVLDLAGQPGSAQSAPLDAAWSPRTVAARYGIDLGALARANTGAALRPGTLLPVSGVFRQLSAADIGHGDPLAALAAYFSVGAATPLTAADLAAFNPGVPLAAQALIRIPPLLYRVAASGPGATLASIAAYYGADPAALLVGGADVAGLFAAPTLAIDTETWDAQDALGRGNVALHFERERGEPPRTLDPKAPPAAVEAYARATMLQLYQLASARLRANAFSKTSVDSAAFGPIEPEDSDAAPRLRSLVAAPAQTDGQPFFYRQALGTSDSAIVEAAPSGTGLPDPSADPYRGVGTILQVELAWQDLFGNRFPGAFAVGADATLPAPLLYADRLLPLDQWPSTARWHRFDGTPGAPVLHVDIAFDPTPYNPSTVARGAHLDAVRGADELPLWQRNARDDLARLTLVYFQLVQNNDGLGVPGLSGPAVTMSLANSLLAQPRQPLADGDRAQLLAYVEGAIRYLVARAAGQAATPPAPVDIALPVALDSLVSTRDIVEIVVSLDFERRSELVAPALRASDGARASSIVPAQGDAATLDARGAGDETAVAFEAYAAGVERLFVTADWLLRVGTGAADPAAPADPRASTLWAVRMAKPGSTAGAGLAFAIGGDPGYYAPLPVASALQTFTAAIRPYVSGKPYDPKAPGVPTTFASADPNTWLARCLTAVDVFLAATYATPCFVLDRLLGLSDATARGAAPANSGYLARLLGHKATLAAAIASTVEPVLAQAASHRDAARDKLEQALLRRLDAANTLTCVAVLPVTGANATVPPGEPAPRLYGQPSGTPVAADLGANFALSTGKIDLAARPAPGAETLAFLVTSRSAESQAYLELDLAWAPTHVEYAMNQVRGIAGYTQSRWIGFLTPTPQVPIQPTGRDHFAIPVALRALPTPATVEAQTATAAGGGSTAPSALEGWRYGFSYLLKQAAQDSVVASVEFNLPKDGAKALAASPEQALYEALAQFSSAQDAVARDIDLALRGIDGRTRATDGAVAAARDAVAAFEAMVGEVARTYAPWASAAGLRAMAAPPPPAIAFTFEMVLEPAADGSALLKVLPRSYRRNGADAPYGLPLAEVAIDAARYAPEQVSADRATGAVTWRYRRRPDATDADALLPYADALLDPRRAIAFAPLDVLTLQDGWASVQVLRNRHLDPRGVATNPVFEFQTAPSRFADPAVPFLRYGAIALDTQGATPRPVAAWLGDFFAGLLGPEGRPVLIGLEATYRYALVPHDAVPLTRLPVALAPPATDPSAAIAAAAQRFFDDAAPRTEGRAGFDVAVTIFSAAGRTALPLMKIDALTLEAASVLRGG